ncbi:DUF4853 domain-containing protein [Cellulomonas flavigena]|uniref:DUF4853 domain-containing protein n=1 Tax=Cellulomonas flavigena TaxID=1711 RepID=UPI000A4DE5CA|nr:DUF4853 domain-containing protein [Cellulomonas flavigena]
MTKKWTPARVGAVVLAVLVVCWLALMWFGGSVPFRDRQSLDEYVDEKLPQLSQIAGQVAAETGGELIVMGLPYVQVCGSGDTQGYRVVGYTTVAPSMSFERLEKLVKANNRDWSSTVQVEKEADRDGTRDIRLIDKYGGLAEFKFSEDSIAMRSRSACLPTDKPLNDPGQFVLPSVEEAFPGMHVTISDNTNPDLHPVPTLTPGANVTPQSGAQSGTQSGE